MQKTWAFGDEKTPPHHPFSRGKGKIFVDLLWTNRIRCSFKKEKVKVFEICAGRVGDTESLGDQCRSQSVCWNYQGPIRVLGYNDVKD